MRRNGRRAITCLLCGKAWSVPESEAPRAYSEHYRTYHASDLEAERI